MLGKAPFLALRCAKCGVPRAKISVDVPVEKARYAICQVCTDIEHLQMNYEAADAAGDYVDCERIACELLELQCL